MGNRRPTFVVQCFPVIKRELPAVLILSLVDLHDFTLLSGYYNGKVVGNRFTSLKVPFPCGKTLS